MKVGNINNVMFKSANLVTKPVCAESDEIKITELKKTTSDFGVQVPQKYSKLGITELENGLKIYSYKLANGHRVTVVPMEDSPTTVKNYVNVGSMNETDDIKGISHFLEHMAFNGTNGTEGYMKLNRGDSFKKIDELGGWTNASTNYAMTDYVNSTPLLEDEDLEQQIKVIAAMTEDLALSEDMVEKEKFPVCSEIDMILDSAETIAIDQTVRSLFNIKSSADELVGGSVSHIQNLDRQKVLDYYNKYYTPDNMHLVITGDVNPDEVMALVSKNFHSKKTAQGKRYDEKLIPVSTKVRKDFITDKSSSANVVIGFAGPKANDVKSQVITDIVTYYISSANFGLYDKMNNTLNVYPDFGQEIISTNPNNPAFLFCGFKSSEENVEKALKLFFDKFSKLKMTDEKQLANIKEALLIDYNDSLERSSYVNNFVGCSTFAEDFDYFANYKNILNSITLEDINEYIDKYFDLEKSAITVVHPETTKENIFSNYEQAKAVSFEGKHKQPVNTDKISETVLDNNYRLAFVETKNSNVPFSLTMKFDIPDDINIASFVVLEQILTKGTMNETEQEFNKYLEENNIGVGTSLYKDELAVYGFSAVNNFEKTAQKAMELINSPRITQDTVDATVKQLKDLYSRHDKTSSDLYKEYESKNNPYYDSISDILENLDKVTVEDVKKLHEYIMANASGIVSINVPENATFIKDKAINSFGSFNKVQEHKYVLPEIYKENQKSVVLTEARNVSQAEISQIYKYKAEDTIKDKITVTLMNSILSSSDTIGLFNSLREQDHLAYRVNSSLNSCGDCGELELYILTSTDNKETGTATYDNLQKSINGFNRQINKLLNSEYKDSDLETAKRAFKAELLNKESVNSKLATVSVAVEKCVGIDYENKAFEMIDSITREDIDNMAKKVFAGKPIYSIVASQDTLDYNKAFLDEIAKC